MLYFVYGLIDPHDNTPRYVGITINPNLRSSQHAKDMQNNEKWTWIQNLQVEALEPHMKIIEVVDELSIAQERERFWVEQYTAQGIQLFNKHLMPKPKPIPQVTPQTKQSIDIISETATDWMKYEDEVNAYNLDCEIFGFENSVSPSITWPWWKKNPHACRILFNKRNRNEIWGILSIIPMEEETIFRLLRKEISTKDIRSEHILTYEAGKHYACYVTPIAVKFEHRHLFTMLLHSMLDFWCEQPEIYIDTLFASTPDNRANSNSQFIWKMYFWRRRDISTDAWELDLHVMNPNSVIQGYQDCIEEKHKHLAILKK